MSGSYVLGITIRCLTNDLGISLSERLSLEGVARADSTGIVESFIDKRSDSPTGVDRITGLAASKIYAYSLHAGRYRGLTWYDEESGVVWLLAAAHHTSGEPDDAYPRFRSLSFDQLLPTFDDYRRLEYGRASQFERALETQVPELRAKALSQPGTEIRGMIAGRIDVRLIALTESYPPILHLAVSTRLAQGAVQTPPEWMGAIVGMLYGHADSADLPYDNKWPGSPVLPDEITFADFVPNR